ncbi:MAG: protein kinase [Pseudomonadota bacterium]
MSSLFKPGDRIGKYTIIELIGHGGMASVYRGQDEDLERAVAIKVLHPHLEDRQEAKERFRREAKAIAKISHPNIVEIYDYSGEDAKQSYIVTQLVSGGNLSSLRESVGQFPIEAAACMAVQVADGLRFAHTCGVVHRDIKPENLLCDKDGTVKIADFGIAHLADAHDMTVTGQILGSPYYMSPEQVLGNHLDEKSDIYSFGSLLFWLATGKLAFDGGNPHAVLRNIVEKEIDDPQRLHPAMGKRLSRIIQRCLKKEPEERYPSLVPIVAELTEYLDLSAVDDIHGEIKAFTDCPDEYRKKRQRKSIATWSERALKLEQTGKIQEAMDLYNRVLALDPDDEQVLGRLKKVRSAQSRRRAVRWSAGVILFFSFLVVIFILGKTYLSKGPGEASDEKGGSTSAIVLPWKDMSYNDDQGDEKEGSAGLAGEKEEGKVKGELIKKKSSHAGISSVAAKSGSEGQMGATRRVRFVPFPKTVNIIVDGKMLGSYFNHQEMDLDVGPHTIRFEPTDEECCEPAEWTVNVLPAKGKNKTQTIGKRLTFKPSSVIVFSGKPADVLIQGTKVGRTGEFIEIPMGESSSKAIEVSASAPGCDAWSRNVLLRAGKKSNLTAKLACE